MDLTGAYEFLRKLDQKIPIKVGLSLQIHHDTFLELPDLIVRVVYDIPETKKVYSLQYIIPDEDMNNEDVLNLHIDMIASKVLHKAQHEFT